MLLDSNIVIYAANQTSPAAEALVSSSGHAIASITLIEVYGYKDLSTEEKQALDTVFARFRVLALDRNVIERAIRLRQARKMRRWCAMRKPGLGQAD